MAKHHARARQHFHNSGKRTSLLYTSDGKLLRPSLTHASKARRSWPARMLQPCELRLPSSDGTVVEGPAVVPAKVRTRSAEQHSCCSDAAICLLLLSASGQVESNRVSLLHIYIYTHTYTYAEKNAIFSKGQAIHISLPSWGYTPPLILPPQIANEGKGIVCSQAFDKGAATDSAHKRSFFNLKPQTQAPKLYEP